MKVFIDDERDPKEVLGENNVENIIWIKDAWEAKNFLLKNESEIEEIHFDHYLGDNILTGGLLFSDLVAADCLYDKGRRWNKLKKVYLHSSNMDIVEDFLDIFEEDLKKIGIELINNSQEY